MAMVLTPLALRQVRQGTKASLGPSFIVLSEQLTISNPRPASGMSFATAMPAPADEGSETHSAIDRLC
jgi:hypothetical protein